jgi:hypothetical protein
MIHKHHENFQGRPVVKQTCDPTYKLWKELQRIIAPFTMKAKSYIKDSYNFKQMFKEVNIKEHFIQLSFDVTSLFFEVFQSSQLYPLSTRNEK